MVCILGLLWPSLFILIALGLTEYCTIKESFIAGLGNETLVTVILIFTFVAYLEESGLSQYIANWLISRKIGENRPWVFTALLFLAAYILSAFTSVTASIICWSIFHKICESIGVSRNSTYVTYGMCGIAIVSSVTSTLFPFKGFSQIFYGLVVKATGLTDLTMDFVPWFVTNFIISGALILGFLLLGKFILRPDVSLVGNAGAVYAHLRNDKMNKSQKTAAITLTLFVISQVLPSFLPKTWALTALLNQFGLIGCTVVCLIVLSVLRDKENVPLINVGHLISKCGGWDLFVMMAATMPLSAAFESEETGILSSVISWMTGVFSGVSATMFLVLVVGLLLLATQVTHNLVLMFVFIPVLAKMGLGYGIHPFIIIILVVMACQCAFLLPASSSPSALIYGSTAWISTKHAYLYNAAFIVMALIVMLVIGVPVGQFFYHSI